jgi:hypothetical protein
MPYHVSEDCAISSFLVNEKQLWQILPTSND